MSRKTKHFAIRCHFEIWPRINANVRELGKQHSDGIPVNFEAFVTDPGLAARAPGFQIWSHSRESAA